MKYLQITQKIEYLKYLIEKEATGGVNQLADKLGVSRRTIFNYLRLLKDQGCEIRFNKHRNTYYFTH